MSVLVVGLSHRTAPVSLLERASVGPDDLDKLVRAVANCEHVARGRRALATCNRVEVYADVDRFPRQRRGVSPPMLAAERGTIDELRPTSTCTTTTAPSPTSSTSPAAWTRWSSAKARSSARPGTLCAWDRRPAPSVPPSTRCSSRRCGSASARTPRPTSTRPAPSLVSLALDRAADAVGPVAGRRALVVGAGSMAGLAVATVSRLGAADIVVASRTEASAPTPGPAPTDGRCGSPRGAEEALADVDVLVSCTGATGIVLPLSVVAAARADAERPLAVVDLALPRDVDPAVAELPGVTLVGLEDLAATLADSGQAVHVEAVRTIVSAEVAAYLAAGQAARVAPTVVALRTMADEVVDAEMLRLGSRLPELDPAVRAEVEHAVRRVADKLLHQPTVRVKELANETGAVSPTPRRCTRSSTSTRCATARSRWPMCMSSRSTGGRLPDDSRDSALARHPAQPARSGSVAQVADGLAAERVRRGRAGRDLDAGRRLATAAGDLGGTGVFVSALRDALLAGEVDLAVHSLKDLPVSPAQGLLLAAVPLREDPRDVLVARDGLTLAGLPAGARIGTGSPRRAAQLRALGLGFDVVGVRGNVDTRVGHVHSGDLDAVVLAWAGLSRLGRLDVVTEVLDPLDMLPAPGQGRWPSSAAPTARTSSPPWSRSTTPRPGPPSPRNARCWPVPRPAAQPPSALSPRWSTKGSPNPRSSCGPWSARPMAPSGACPSPDLSRTRSGWVTSSPTGCSPRAPKGFGECESGDQFRAQEAGRRWGAWPSSAQGPVTPSC